MTDEITVEMMYNAYKFTIEMINDRKIEGVPTLQTFNEFSIKANVNVLNGDIDELIKRISYVVNDTIAVCLFPTNLQRSDIGWIVEYFAKITAADDIILIHPKELHTATKDEIKEKKAEGKTISTFLFKDVQTNPRNSVFFPQQFRIMSNKEKIEFLKSIITKQGREPINTLPIILTDDFLVRYMGAKRGNLIEIIDWSLECPERLALEIRVVGGKRKN
jgi:DNA-directed RNA polymerase subunit H (RpoH/RPB5)